MSKNKQHLSELHSPHLSLEQMQEYLEERLPATGMHQVEKHLLDCELCSDALEGLSTLPLETNLADNISQLKYKIRKKSLRDPIVRRKRKIVPLLWKPVSVAAAIIILLSGTFLLLRIDKHSQQTSEEISLSAPKKAPKVAPPASTMQDNNAPAQVQERELAMNSKPKRARGESPAVKQSLLQQTIPTLKAEEALHDGITDTTSFVIPPVVASTEPEIREENKPGIPSITLPKATASNAPAAPRSGVNLRPASGISQSLINISGKVVTDNDIPLSGVNVFIKGTNNGIITDAQGNYNLLAPIDGTLVFNFIGMQTEEVPVKNQNKIDISLQPDMQALNEVVVTGELKKKYKLENNSYQRPEPTGGYTDFKKYIKYQLRYPEEAKKNQIEGTVRVEFVVQPNGALSDFYIKKSLGYGCDEEAIRLMKEGPLWHAAEVNGEAVKRKVEVNVLFKL